MILTKTKTKTKTNTKPKYLKDPTYAIFLKSRRSKDIKYDIQTKPDFNLADLIIELAFLFQSQPPFNNITNNIKSITYRSISIFTFIFVQCKV